MFLGLFVESHLEMSRAVVHLFLYSRRSFFSRKVNLFESATNWMATNFLFPDLSHLCLSKFAMSSCKLSKCIPVSKRQGAGGFLAGGKEFIGSPAIWFQAPTKNSDILTAPER